MKNHILSYAAGGGVISLLLVWLLSMFGLGELLLTVIVMALPGMIAGSGYGLYEALSARAVQEESKKEDGEAE